MSFDVLTLEELTEELTPADLVGEETDEDSLDDMWLLS
jgi:hypothetical protein